MKQIDPRRRQSSVNAAATLSLRAGPMTIDDFYRAHHADAVRWATALVGSREVGEELAQEALLAVSRKLGSIDQPAAYLRRAVVNRATSWHRWHIRERARIRRAAAGQATSYTEPTNDMLGALGALPHRQRVAITMRFWADWTDDQIADALGCAPASVRVMVHRGLAALKQEMSE